jgi:hypothetical protein
MGDLDDDDNFRSAWALASGMSALKLVNGGDALPLPDDWRSMPRDIAAIFDRIFQDFAARQGKTRWCEKSPQHVQQLPLLREVFPSAKFIHVIRDGRASAASLHRRWRRSPYLSVYRWKNVVRAGRLEGQRMPGQYLEVQYEQLTRDPEAWMRRICEFLGLDFEPAVLESRMPQSTERGTKGKISARKASWYDYFGSRSLAALEDIAGAELAALGYETHFRQGDTDPTPLRRKFWKIKDSAWLFLLLVVEKLKGSPRPWSTLWTQPLESIRQAKSNDY